MASFAVYSNTLSGSFVYDDHLQIEWNPLIRSIKNIPAIFSSNAWGFAEGWVSNYYRPVTPALHSIVFSLVGLRPWGFHLLNILFHVLCSLFVFLLVREVLAKTGHENAGGRFFSVPFAAALLFSLHPVHTEAVAWATALPEVSFSLFYMTSLYFYVKSDPYHVKKGAFYYMSLLSFLLSLFSKEQAVTLPVVIICYDLLVRKVSFSKKQLWNYMRTYGGYAAVMLVYFIFRFYALGFISPLSSKGQGQMNLTGWQMFLNIFPLFVKYLEKLLYPFNLNAFYTYHVESLLEPDTLISIAVAASFIVPCVILYRKNRLAFFALLLIVITLSPAFYLKAIQANTMAERYLYLPSLGFVILVALGVEWAASRGTKWMKYSSVFLFMLLCLYAVGTFNRNKVWKDDYSLWSDTVKKSPEAAAAHDGFGAALSSRGMYDEAIKEYLKALSLHEDAATHNNLGLAYEESGQLDKAIEQYERAVAMNPLLADAYYNMGIALQRKGLVEEAIEKYKAAIRIRPDSDAYFNLGNLLMKQGKTVEAISAYESSLRLNWRNDTANMLRIAYERMRDQSNRAGGSR